MDEKYAKVSFELCVSCVVVTYVCMCVCKREKSVEEAREREVKKREKKKKDKKRIRKDKKIKGLRSPKSSYLPFPTPTCRTRSLRSMDVRRCTRLDVDLQIAKNQ